MTVWAGKDITRFFIWKILDRPQVMVYNKYIEMSRVFICFQCRIMASQLKPHPRP